MRVLIRFALSVMAFFWATFAYAGCTPETLEKLIAKDFSKAEILRLCDQKGEEEKPAVPAPAKYAPPYKCDPTKGTFPDGLCKPFPTEPNIPIEIRGRLYLACVQGNDAYNAPSCCDHLTRSMAASLRVCPTPQGGIVIDKQTWDDAVKIMGIVVAL